MIKSPTAVMMCQVSKCVSNGPPVEGSRDQVPHSSNEVSSANPKDGGAPSVEPRLRGSKFVSAQGSTGVSAGPPLVGPRDQVPHITNDEPSPNRDVGVATLLEQGHAGVPSEEQRGQVLQQPGVGDGPPNDEPKLLVTLSLTETHDYTLTLDDTHTNDDEAQRRRKSQEHSVKEEEVGRSLIQRSQGQESTASQEPTIGKSNIRIFSRGKPIISSAQHINNILVKSSIRKKMGNSKCRTLGNRTGGNRDIRKYFRDISPNLDSADNYTYQGVVLGEDEDGHQVINYPTYVDRGAILFSLDN